VPPSITTCHGLSPALLCESGRRRRTRYRDQRAASHEFAQIRGGTIHEPRTVTATQRGVPANVTGATWRRYRADETASQARAWLLLRAHCVGPASRVV